MYVRRRVSPPSVTGSCLPIQGLSTLFRQPNTCILSLSLSLSLSLYIYIYIYISLFYRTHAARVKLLLFEEHQEFHPHRACLAFRRCVGYNTNWSPLSCPRPLHGEPPPGLRDRHHVHLHALPDRLHRCPQTARTGGFFIPRPSEAGKPAGNLSRCFARDARYHSRSQARRSWILARERAVDIRQSHEEEEGIMILRSIRISSRQGS